MDNKTQLKKAKANIPEIITDFSKNKFGELIINVNYNNTLSNERKKLERNTKPYSDNIMIKQINNYFLSFYFHFS